MDWCNAASNEESVWPEAASTPKQGQAAVSCHGPVWPAMDQQGPCGHELPLGHSARILATNDSLFAILGRLLVAGRHRCYEMSVVRELVRQLCILDLLVN